VNDGGCRKCVAGLRLTWYDRLIGDERYHDELQSNEAPADDPTIT
jgi:hypothetical protein